MGLVGGLYLASLSASWRRETAETQATRECDNQSRKARCTLPKPPRHQPHTMAKKSMIAKANRTPKFSTRTVRRCYKCGRPRGFMRDFNLCRVCFREEALEGNIPGIKKSSW